MYMFQLHGTKTLSSFSPYAVKLAHWLRMANVPHTLLSPFPTPPGPTGKIPFVEFNGKTIGDSCHIVDRLESAFGKDLDEWLSPSKKATALAVQRMVEEHVYFIEVYYRWQSDDYWRTSERIYAEGLPIWYRYLIRYIGRPIVIAQVKGQGIGRMTEEMIARRAQKDVEAISNILGEEKFLMGDKPCTADASVFGFLHCILDCGIETPLVGMVREHKNLVEYVDRNLRVYWDDKTS